MIENTQLSVSLREDLDRALYQEMSPAEQLRIEKAVQKQFLVLKALRLNVRQWSYTTKWVGQIAGGIGGFVVGSFVGQPVKGGKIMSQIGGLITSIPGATIGVILAPTRMAIMCNRSVKYTVVDIFTVCEVFIDLLADLPQHDKRQPSVASLKFERMLQKITEKYPRCQSASSKRLWEHMRYSMQLTSSCIYMISYLIEREAFYLKNQGKKLFNTIMEEAFVSFEITPQYVGRGDLSEREQQMSQKFKQILERLREASALHPLAE